MHSPPATSRIPPHHACVSAGHLCGISVYFSSSYVVPVLRFSKVGRGLRHLWAVDPCGGVMKPLNKPRLKNMISNTLKNTQDYKGNIRMQL